MSNSNCPQIHEQYQNLLDLKKKFEQASDSADRERLMKELKIIFSELEKIMDVFVIAVDYSRPFDEMIKVGKYTFIDEDIKSENFVFESKVESRVIFQFINFPKSIEKTSDIIPELDKIGLRPATLQEFLAFGAKYKKKKFRNGVGALGLSWYDKSGEDRMPCINLGDLESGQRSIVLGYYGVNGNWGETYGYLVVRK